jgi:tetratricopeptide (TPR) repeat protein
MKRALGLLLLIGLTALAQERTLVKFRLVKDPESPMRGWVVSFTEEGFKFARFGGDRTVRIPWRDLVEEDRLRLRRQLKLDRSEEEERGVIKGHRIHFKGGQQLDGVLDRIDDDGRHWLRTKGLLLPYPGDRVERVEEVDVAESAVYDEHELYLLRLQRDAPASASGHRALADYAFEVGEFADARPHYEKAIRLRPKWRALLQARIDEIDALLRDAEVARKLGRVKRRSRLDRDFEGARALLAEFLEAHPDRKRLALQVGDEIEVDRTEWIQRRFHRIKVSEFDRAVTRYVISKSPSIQEAMAWATSDLADEMAERLKKRLNLNDQELEALYDSERKGSPHWAAYWSGSFVISKRAVIGKSSKREVRGDPDDWWDLYADADTRGNFLRAYAVERLPKIFEVVQVKLPHCDACGGTGALKKSSARNLPAVGGHEWHQRCNRCFGAKRDRLVGYR